MTNKTKTEIKAFFETGDTPTQAQFIDAIDSWVDKSGPIGVLETAVSAGTAGFVYASAGDADILSTSDALSRLGATVYTTALSSAVASDTINAIIATTAQANAGTATGVLMNPVLTKNAIASQAGAGGALVYISSQTASNSASVEFTTGIDSTYEEYIIEGVDIVCATDDQDLLMTFSTDGGSSYLNSGYGYAYTQMRAGGVVGGVDSASTSSIKVTDTQQNGAGYGAAVQIRLYNPAGATLRKLGYVSAVDFQSTNIHTIAGACMNTTTSAISAVKFAYSSGNITSGVFRLYGVKKS